MKTVHVCNCCGSANIQQDAWVHYNDRENVQTFDDLYCEVCQSSCKTNEVTVPADFDVYSDFYKYPDGERSALDSEDQDGVL